jgi:hypothetical protein
MRHLIINLTKAILFKKPEASTFKVKVISHIAAEERRETKSLL